MEYLYNVYPPTPPLPSPTHPLPNPQARRQPPSPSRDQKWSSLVSCWRAPLPEGLGHLSLLGRFLQPLGRVLQALLASLFGLTHLQCCRWYRVLPAAPTPSIFSSSFQTEYKKGGIRGGSTPYNSGSNCLCHQPCFCPCACGMCFLGPSTCGGKPATKVIIITRCPLYEVIIITR